MKKIRKINGNVSFFLVSAILILCAGFLIVSCGKPQTKTKNTNAKASAVDFSSAASGGPCPVAPCVGAAPGTESNPLPSIDNSGFTLEAWVKKRTSGSLNGAIFGFMDSKGGMLYVKDDVPKFVIRRLPAAGDEALANRTVLTECVSNGVTTTECIVPAITQAGSIANVAGIFSIPGPAVVTTTISSAMTVNSVSLASIFVPSVTSTVTQIQLSSGTAVAVTLPAGEYQASPTPGVASTTFSATINAVTNHTPVILAKDVWTHIAGVLTTEDQSSGPGNCATDGAEIPHIAIYINGELKNCAGTNGQYAVTSLSNKYDIAAGGIDEFLDILPGMGSWAGNGSFEGVIDEARAWNYARSASKIAKCMNTELGTSGGDCDRGDPGLIGYFRFNEGEGKDITDISGRGFSGSFEYTIAPQVFGEYEDGWVEPGAPISRKD